MKSQINSAIGELLMSVLVFLILAIGYATASGCPTGYTTIDNSTCYKVSAKLVTRGVAAAWCGYDGASLASVPNGFANTYIYQLAKSQQANIVWLGTKCPNENISTCRNDDQSTFGPYSNFYKGNPSAAGDCVVMSLSGVTSQQWLSYACPDWSEEDKKAGYACAIPYGSKTRCLDNYAYFQGMCYSFSSPIGRTRDTALKNCQKIPGGYLASVPNPDVNGFLAGVEYKYTNINPSSYFGLQCPNVTFDGDTSSCKWDDGTAFNFSAFPKGFPRVRNNDKCVNFNVGLWMNHMDCGFNEYFCQAPVLN